MFAMWFCRTYSPLAWVYGLFFLATFFLMALAWLMTHLPGINFDQGDFDKSVPVIWNTDFARLVCALWALIAIPAVWWRKFRTFAAKAGRAAEDALSAALGALLAASIVIAFTEEDLGSLWLKVLGCSLVILLLSVAIRRDWIDVLNVPLAKIIVPPILLFASGWLIKQVALTVA